MYMLFAKEQKIMRLQPKTSATTQCPKTVRPVGPVHVNVPPRIPVPPIRSGYTMSSLVNEVK